MTQNEIMFYDLLEHQAVYRPFQHFSEKEKDIYVFEDLAGGTLLDIINWHIMNGRYINQDQIGVIIFEIALFLKEVHFN